MTRIYTTITPEQERFLLALLLASSIADAARKAETPEATARRWLRRADVKAAWLDMRRMQTEAAMMVLHRATAKAAETLQACMGAKMPPAVRLSAAKSILELNQHMIELGELAARVEALEESLADRAAEESGHTGAMPTPLSRLHA